ncbi:MAG: CapA family protein [Patescibacteria group bacterium]
MFLVFWLPNTQEIVVLNPFLKKLFIPEQKTVSFIIGGDMMFARGVHARYENNLHESVEKLGDVFSQADMAIVNLEGAISATPIRPDPGSHFKFVFPPETVDVLVGLGIDAVSQDNNHANNGNVDVTQELLERQGISVLPHTVEGKKLKLTLIGIHTLWGVKDITGQIRDLTEDPDMRVIIFPHWGEEYKPIHNTQQEQLAHAWIDAGADMVVGAHPHVVQDAEIYRDKPIIYSLGNLVFDQDWSIETQRGILVMGEFTDEDLEISIMPIISKNYQPMLASSQWIPFSSWILDRK